MTTPVINQPIMNINNITSAMKDLLQTDARTIRHAEEYKAALKNYREALPSVELSLRALKKDARERRRDHMFTGDVDQDVRTTKEYATAMYKARHELRLHMRQAK